MTQEDVGKRFDLSRSTIAQMELGNREVTSLELDRFAYLYGMDILHFLSEDAPQGDVMAVLFRAHPELREDRPFLDSLRPALVVGRELSNLEHLLEVEREVFVPTVYPLKAPKTRWEAIQQGNAVAARERRRLDLGEDPIPDIADVLDRAGVITGEVSFPEDVSGLTVEGPDVGILVAVNKEHPRIRQRFSFAHEYAHVLLDRDHPIVSRASERNESCEVRANAFAAAFLMPEDGVRRYVSGLGKGRQSRASVDVYDEKAAIRGERRTPAGTQEIQIYDLVQISHHFGVSEIAALYRIRNMRPSLVNDSEFERLKEIVDSGRSREIRAGLGLPDPEAHWRRQEFRHRFLGLTLEAYRRELISRSKMMELARLVGASPDAMGRLIDESGIDLEKDPDAPESGG
jgi:Zn-dependent peptidase ImmA (M78 family)/transcriptional regulator with XRE-family HTH domain